MEVYLYLYIKQEREPLVSVDRWQVSPQISGLDALEQRKILYSCRELNHDLSNVQPIV